MVDKKNEMTKLPIFPLPHISKVQAPNHGSHHYLSPLKCLDAARRLAYPCVAAAATFAPFVPAPLAPTHGQPMPPTHHHHLCLPTPRHHSRHLHGAPSLPL